MTPAQTKAATTNTQSTRKPRAGGKPPRSAPSAPAPRVRHMHDDAYWVESRSHPGMGHHTTPDSCTCAAARWGRTCWHLTFVRAYHGWRQQQLAAPAVSTPMQQRAEPVELSSYFE